MRPCADARRGGGRAGLQSARMSNRNGASSARYSRRNWRAIRERCRCFSGVTASSGEPNSSRGRGSRLHFDERDRLAVVSDQIDFAFHSAIGEISRDHDVTVPAEIPIGVGFAAHAGAPRLAARRPRASPARTNPPGLCARPSSPMPNMARANIGTALSSPDFSVISVPSVLKPCRTHGKALTQRAQRTQRKLENHDRLYGRLHFADALLPAFARRIRPAPHRSAAAGRCESYFLRRPAAASLSRTRRSTMASRRSPARSLVFWSRTISTPIISPLPRTSPTILCRAGQSAMRSIEIRRRAARFQCIAFRANPSSPEPRQCTRDCRRTSKRARPASNPSRSRARWSRKAACPKRFPWPRKECPARCPA